MAAPAQEQLQPPQLKPPKKGRGRDELQIEKVVRDCRVGGLTTEEL